MCACDSQHITRTQVFSRLAALPDHLLAAVLTHACSTAVDEYLLLLPAAAVVRDVAQLAHVCRRFRALLRAHPPLLSLDFRDPLTLAQMAWLARETHPHFGVRAAFFRESNEEEASLWWEGPHLLFLANQAPTLRELGGLPYHLVAEQGAPVFEPSPGSEPLPPLDLSGSAITRLHLVCWGTAPLLVAARLPARLETLVLTGEDKDEDGYSVAEPFPTWSGAPDAEPLGAWQACRRSGALLAGTAYTSPLGSAGRARLFLSMHQAPMLPLKCLTRRAGAFAGRLCT